MTSSGTAREVIRLWITVAPISLLNSRPATRAVTADGDTGCPDSSTTKHRSASPSKASPISARVAITCFCRSTRLSGSSGLASWLGKVPSSSKYSGSTSSAAKRAEDRGRGVTGHPVARHRRRPATAASRSNRPASAGIRRIRRARRGPTSCPPDRRTAGTPAITSSLTVDSPVSLPTGLAPARHSLMPL